MYRTVRMCTQSLKRRPSILAPWYRVYSASISTVAPVVRRQVYKYVPPALGQGRTLEYWQTFNQFFTLRRQ